MRKTFDLENADYIFPEEKNYEKTMSTRVGPILEEVKEDYYFKTLDGTRIHYAKYKNPDCKAIIVISHGFCEFTDKFEEVIFMFYQEGYTVYIHDHRGHGYSDRQAKDLSKVYVLSYDEYVSDLHELVQIAKKENPKFKIALYAHSMGGTIGTLYIEQYAKEVDCAIMSSPMFKMNTGGVPISITYLVAAIKKIFRKETTYVPAHGPFQGVSNFEESSCVSKARYDYIFKKRMEDEKYQTYGATYAWTLASIKGVRRLHKEVNKIEIPFLLFQAGRDTMVKNSGQNSFMKKFGKGKMIVIPNSKHEIYNGDGDSRKEYYINIFQFLDQVVKEKSKRG